MVGKVQKVERVGKSGNGKGCGPTNSGSATSRRNRSARFCHTLRCVIRYVWYNVYMCVCVCVWGGGGGGDMRTLYPMKVLQTHLKTYTVLSQLVQPLYQFSDLCGQSI